MNKNVVLAIALSFFVIFIWSKLTPKSYHIETQEVTQEEPQAAPSFLIPAEEGQETLISAFSHNRELVFSLPSACLKKIVFFEFDNHEFNLGQGFCLPERQLVFTEEKIDSAEAIFVYQDEKIRISKHFNYSNPDFIITLDIEIENLCEQPLSYSPDLILGTIDLNSRELDSRFKEVFLKQPEKILRFNPGKATKLQYGGDFFGFRGRYFCAIFVPLSFPGKLQIVRLNRAKSQISLSMPTMEISSNQSGLLQYELYLGPQQVGLLKSFQNGTEEVIHYGFFDPISKVLLRILRFFFGIVHNWGWATIILSLFVFFILFPLSMKQMHSMKEMQRLQPKIEELRRLYKDNPQRLNKETLELYRRHKINPLGGCLPMVLQIPIFFALYQALMRSIELKGAHFLWIKDLSQPDRLIASPEINILPILMAITMFLQQKFGMMMSSGNISGASSSKEQQRLMTFLFPVMFGFIFYGMPSGLVLYWFINSLLMFAHQSRMKLSNAPAKR